jgi:hypothetical protein
MGPGLAAGLVMRTGPVCAGPVNADQLLRYLLSVP